MTLQDRIDSVHAPTMADNFVQVCLQVSAPSVTRKSTTAKAAAVRDAIERGADAATAEKMLNASKSLFPNGELSAINRPAGQFRDYLRRVSLDWIGNGMKLIPITAIDNVERRFGEAQLVRIPLVSEFCDNYEATLAGLRATMGAAFDESLYPHPASIRDRFKFAITFKPIENPDQFSIGGMSGAQADALKAQLAKAMTDAAEDAVKKHAAKVLREMQDLPKQVMGGKVNGKFTRLSGDKLGKIQEMLEADLNVTGDPVVTETMLEAREAVLACVEARETENDSYERDQAATKAQRAVDKLKVLM